MFQIDIQELEFGCTSKLSHFPISNSGLYLFIFSLSSLFFYFSLYKNALSGEIIIALLDIFNILLINLT